MIELWRAHRAERAAQRAYLHALSSTDVSLLDARDLLAQGRTTDMLDSLAGDVFGPGDDDD